MLRPAIDYRCSVAWWRWRAWLLLLNKAITQVAFLSTGNLDAPEIIPGSGNNQMQFIKGLPWHSIWDIVSMSHKKYLWGNTVRLLPVLIFILLSCVALRKELPIDVWKAPGQSVNWARMMTRLCGWRYMPRDMAILSVCLPQSINKIEFGGESYAANYGYSGNAENVRALNNIVTFW